MKTINLSVSPNPFVRELDIRFHLEEEGQTEIALFDVFGRRIADLFTGHQVAGNNRLQTDLSQEALPAGVYILILRQGERMVTQLLRH